MNKQYTPTTTLRTNSNLLGNRSQSAPKGQPGVPRRHADPINAAIPQAGMQRSASTYLAAAFALTAGALALVLTSLSAQAQVTEDCILEGTVDMRKAEHLGQPVYVRFENARAGTEGQCSMSRRGSRNRRVQFVGTPNLQDLDGASHGARVHYRYVERDGAPGTWELIEVGQ